MLSVKNLYNFIFNAALTTKRFNQRKKLAPKLASIFYILIGITVYKTTVFVLKIIKLSVETLFFLKIM